MGWGIIGDSSTWRSQRRRAVVSAPTWACRSRKLSGFEGEKIPPVAIFFDRRGMDRVPDECGNGTRPKFARERVGLQNANVPRAGESAPGLMGNVSPDSAAAVAAGDEELGHIPGNFVASEFGPSLHQDESRQVAVDLHQKRMARGIGPVKREGNVAELAVGSEIEVVELAEIVGIELEEVCQDGLLVDSGGDEFE